MSVSYGMTIPDCGAFILVGITAKQVLQVIDVAVSINNNGNLGLSADNYMDKNISTEVV